MQSFDRWKERYRTSRIYNKIRVVRTAKRFVTADTVADTSDVTRDTFTDITYIPVLCFITPVRIGDQSTSHTDQISITSGKDVIGDLRITDISDRDRRLSEFITNRLRHV